jgi:enoyl-CoA hydratase/carnithine racemase
MIRVEDLGRVRVIAMEHGKANALDVELLGALEAAIAEAERAAAPSY